MVEISDFLNKNRDADWRKILDKKSATTLNLNDIANALEGFGDFLSKNDKYGEPTDVPANF